MRVLIIGAGCTGLLVAQGLRKHGIEATVYERSNADRLPRDWTMMVHWGAEYMQQLLPEDVFAVLRDAESEPWTAAKTGETGERPVWNGKTGEVHVMMKAVVFKRYSRKRLCQILAKGIDIRFGQELTDIHVLEGGGVEAIFADGSRELGDILLGVDSANSRVRSWLLDGAPTAQASELPMTVYNFSSSYSDAALARRLRDHPHPLMTTITHPDHLTWYMIAPLDVPDPVHPEQWSFQHFMTQWSERDDDAVLTTTSAERLAHFKRIGATYAEPFRSATAQIPESTRVPPDRLKYWAQQTRWDNRQGRVTLAGDAAHPFPPHRAQGLNNGIQDAVNFVAVAKELRNGLEGPDAAAMVTAYEDETLERRPL